MTQNLKTKMVSHIANGTALLAISQPVFSLVDRILEIPIDVSLNNRYISAAATLTCLGWLVDTTRQASQRFFRVDTTTKNAKLAVHDVGYSVGTSLVVSPAIYWLAGGRDPYLAVTSTVAATALNAVVTPVGLCLNDIFQDWMGLRSSEYLPKSVRILPKRAKQTLAALLIGGSLASIDAIYAGYDTSDKTSAVQQYELRRQKEN